MSPMRIISLDYARQILQNSLATVAVKESLVTALDEARNQEVESLKDTIRDLQAQLREAVEKKQIAEQMMAAEGVESPGGSPNFNSTRHLFDAGDLPAQDDGAFLVAFEIDPATMEVRVDVMPGDSVVV